MNGYSESDVFLETIGDDEFALAYGYEIISKKELFDLSYHRRQSGASSSASPAIIGLEGKRKKGLVSKPSVTSFASTSTQSSGVSSMMPMMSSCSLLLSHSSHEDDNVSIPDLDDIDEEEEHDFQMSVDRIWRRIQQKGHYHDNIEEVVRMAIATMEQTSNTNKLTTWFRNLLHFPEKLRQISADKRRFNIENAPKTIRNELKSIYVY